MKKKAVFLDRDGTINVDFGYVYKLQDLKFIDHVEDCLLRLQKAGFLLIIITNQSGIGREMFKLEDADAFNSYLVDKLAQKSIYIKDIFMCPHSPDQNCECRKPSAKMIEDAMGKYNISSSQSYMLGDKESDVESGNNAGVKSFLINENNTFEFWTNYILNKSNE